MPRGLHFFCLLGVASTSPCRAWLCHRICTAWPWEACWIVDISSGLRQPNFTGIEKQDLATWGLVETPELRSRRFTSIFANIDVWQKLQPKLGWRNFASIIEKLDFQRLLQSELGWCSFTSIFAKFDFWCWLQPKLERLPASLQKLTFGQDFNQSLDRVVLPASLQTLPESLQELTFEDYSNQPWGKSARALPKLEPCRWLQRT